ncbi:GNAT family N-acetyltransferase [archaeon]|jgi:[ribosomal protein S5]-alanine N-acetyltransferase|nr:GNAT family N-acetyltransferase [archaeon]MBT4397459.1 GNAT family N-acetyltransferase [archaeon]MBT4440531.1 GNAT family N-acetyltransferase [archaeon]
MKLETKRLILRKPKLSDVDDLVNGMNNINVSKWLASVPFPYTKKDGKWYINDCIKEWKKKTKTKYAFFIELKSEKKVIGALDLLRINSFSKIGETGSWLNENYWRNAYMTEAKIVLMEFAFNKLKLNKLKTYTYSNNKASKGVQQKLGYELMGVFKKDERSKATGKFHDTHYYDLFKKDWKKLLPKLKKDLDKKIKMLENS